MAEISKITKNSNGLIILRDGEDNLISFFDPSGVFVNDSPRSEGCVSISKTPSPQDDQEAIEIKCSEIIQIGVNDSYSDPSIRDVKEALSELFNAGGGNGLGVAETAIGVYRAFIKIDGASITAVEVQNTIGSISATNPSGGQVDFASENLFVQDKTAIIFGNRLDGYSYSSVINSVSSITTTGVSNNFFIEIKIYA